MRVGKRQGFIIFLLIFTVIAGTIYFQYNKKLKSKSANSANIVLEPVKKNIGGINIMIDPRIELLAAVQYASSYDEKYNLMTKQNFSYKDRNKGYFSKFSKHGAVKTFDEMSSTGFSYDAPPTAMLYLNNPLNLKLRQNFSDYLIGRAGESSLNKFADQLQQFALDSKFDEFYNKNKEFYKEVIEKNGKIIEGGNYIEDIEQYYGMKQNCYNIILSPMFHSGGFGPRVKNKDGGYDIYSILGPLSVEGDIPIFGDKESFRYLVLHEFSHSFVNPETEKNISEVNKYSKLYDPISEAMKSNAYTNWESCVNEHIVRAVTSRLAYLKSGKEAYDKAIYNEKASGFFYVEALCKKLEEYEKNRTKYKSFNDFYPELIKVFAQLSSKDLGKNFYSVKFNGTINSVHLMRKPMVIIVPTNEENKKTEQKIQEYAQQIYTNFKEEQRVTIKIITDKEALNSDLKDNTLMAYGTMEGNLWLKKYCKNFPFKIEQNKITIKKIYGGNSLRLITAVPSPINSDNALVIYTSQKAEEIDGINSVFSGPTSFVVADGKTEVEAGNY